MSRTATVVPVKTVSMSLQEFWEFEHVARYGNWDYRTMPEATVEVTAPEWLFNQLGF